jgi:hypothetical protein
MHKQHVIVGILLGGLLTLAGCGGDSHDSAMTDFLDVMEQVSSVLADVKDQATAKAAALKLKELRVQVQAIKKRMADLGDPSKQEQEQLMEKHKDRREKIKDDIKRLTLAIRAKPDFRSYIEPPMTGMPFY